MNKEERKLKRTRTGLIISTAIVSAIALTFIVLYGVTMSSLNKTSMALEYSYERSYYDLVDNINNAEIKMSKVLVSQDKDYTEKLLREIVENTSNASENLSNLPISINGLSETTKFINKVNGYSTTLVQKLERGENLTSEEKQNLNNIYTAIREVKSSLNNFSLKLYEGYSILDSSLKIDGDYNDLTNNIKDSGNDIEYPTMIYDGPFADSVISKEVKGLTGSDITKEEAQNKILEIFGNITSDNIEYQSETNGRFVTYDFTATTQDQQSLFIQITKKGGELLTVSSYSSSITNNINLSKAENIAKDFCDKAGIENSKVVWSNIYNGSAYVNIASTQNNVILYADLVKLKIDLNDGRILGYDASNYWTNHTNRNIPSATLGATDALAKIDSEFEVKNQRLALSPLDWNREVLCYEFECSKMGATYYIYINAQTGAEENILKVIETDSGNQLL